MISDNQKTAMSNSDFPIDQVMALLEQTMVAYPQPIVDVMGDEQQSPFRILIATVLSLRTKDTMTAQAAARLFAIADTPHAMLMLAEKQVAELIYPVGFYRNKARSILAICHILIEQYQGAVPSDMETLVSLPGVGRKTANLVITKGYNLPGICVDTHVHRICNRWGYVQTKTAEMTEYALREKLPAAYWIRINGWLVTLGQNICHPTSPRCSQCVLASYCGRVGVTRSR
jgi:endonuclease-3